MMADSFVPGSDFIPGSDLVPGVTDVLGIDTPGISDILGSDSGTDWAPGIDQAGSGVDQSWTNAAKQLMNSPYSSAASKLIKSGLPSSTGSNQSKPALGAAGTDSSATSMNKMTSPDLSPGLTGTGGGQSLYDFSPSFNLPAMSNTTTQAPQLKFADGGEVSEEPTETEHQPQFYSEGGLQNRFVQGDGDGTSDSVPAMLANGEFVIPADVVSALGNGSNDSGANVLDNFLETIRAHKQDHAPHELPPDSEGPLEYLSKAQNKANS